MMGALDYILLALLGAYAAVAVRRKRKCSGDCGTCRGCRRTK